MAKNSLGSSASGNSTRSSSGDGGSAKRRRIEPCSTGNAVDSGGAGGAAAQSTVALYGNSTHTDMRMQTILHLWRDGQFIDAHWIAERKWRTTAAVGEFVGHVRAQRQ